MHKNTFTTTTVCTCS